MTIATLPMASVREGAMMVTVVDGLEILVCQVDGQYYAMANHCSHARQALVTGRLSGFELRCPLHGARFDVRTGACLAAPATQGIRTFPTYCEGGKVCVSVRGP